MSARTSHRAQGSRSAPPAPSTAAPPQTTGSQPNPAAERLAYSVTEAARLTGLSRDLLYDEMRRGNLAYIKVGRRRLITRQHLEQFLDITPSSTELRGVRASAHSTGSDAP
jgi:excisionase family DNA binding protein